MARVLLIEDHPDNLELMTFLLEHFGHTTVRAGDGPEGIAAARRERPDLIVCDIHLPSGDGFSVARALKADPELARIPLVAVTALAMVGDRDRVLAAGFDGYITKPIDPQRFVADLETLLPAHDGATMRPPAPLPPLDDGASERERHQASILVVDDLPTNRELMRETLQPFGYDVRLAGSVSAALRMVGERVPHLIISDLHMPGADGFSLVRAIKADPVLARLPLVLLSSSSWNGKDRQMAMELGVARFLLRPIEPQQLIEEIEACLAGRS